LDNYVTIIFHAAGQWSIEIIMDSCLPGEGNYVKVVGANNPKKKTLCFEAAKVSHRRII